MPVRNLFTREELGLTNFEQLRQKAFDEFKNPADIEEYKKNFPEIFPNLLLDEKRDNLKKFIFLADSKSDDLEAIKSALLEYQNTYNNIVHYVKDFCFGTQIMRLFYLLDLPDDAVKVHKIHLNSISISTSE